MRRFDFSKALFITSLTMLIFGYGAAVGRYQIFPFGAMQFAVGSVKQVAAERDAILGRRPLDLVEQARYSGNRVSHSDSSAAFAGLTLLGGFIDNQLEYRLIRMDGSVVAEWPIRFHDLFPDPSFVKPNARVPQTDWNAGVQGAQMLRDGSLAFTFEGLGFVKLDRCGVVQWKVPQMTHHSVDLAEDGGYWVPSLRYVEKDSRFPGLTPPYDEDLILRISADGAILDDISIFELFFTNHLEWLLFANGLEDIRVPEKENLTHLNDVEELTSDMAVHFPQFAAGDLLISLRNYNLLMVIDPRTHEVKWHQTGPWIKQHDPNFEANGRIAVFNNNSDGTNTGSILGGSNILSLDPRTGATEILYGNGRNQKLFTKFRGKHQILPNGNRLITESHAGRVLEIDPNGNTVWEFINRFDEKSVAIVGIAKRYTEDYFQVKDWTCGE